MCFCFFKLFPIKCIGFKVSAARITTTSVYCILSSKHPWVLEIDGQKTGVGGYADKPFVCITHIPGIRKP